MITKGPERIGASGTPKGVRNMWLPFHRPSSAGTNLKVGHLSAGKFFFGRTSTFWLYTSTISRFSERFLGV